jgi:glucose-1-phosphate adenylyltransferase
MELIDVLPEFNLYEEYWKIYTRNEVQPPQYLGPESSTSRSIIGEGSEIYGEVHNSVIGCGVKIGKGTIVSHSIIMNGTVIGENCNIEKAVIAENVNIGNNVRLGEGDEVQNETKPGIYRDGIVTIGEQSVIPNGVRVGKNTMISGVTTEADYPEGVLGSGRTLDKAGDR